MREFTVTKNDAGQRLDRWLGKTLPLLPAPLAQKYIRLKRVKLNGKGAKRDVRLAEGDLLGLVLFITSDGAAVTGDTEYKLAQTIAAFLGRHMEG